MKKYFRPWTVRALALAILVPSTIPAYAEEFPADPPPANSVYRIRPAIDYPLLGAASLGATVPLFFQDKIVTHRGPVRREDVNRFDRPVIGNDSNAAAWTSHFVVGLALTAPIVLDYSDLGWSPAFKEDLFVYAQTLAINSSINHLLRYSNQRARPIVYSRNPPPTDSGSYISFNAGHVASTVAALSAASMTYGSRYGHKALPWVITGVVGVTEGALRSAAGKHFFTDDILGLAVGTTVGTLVPYFHRRGRSSPVVVVPTTDGAQVVWQKQF